MEKIEFDHYTIKVPKKITNHLGPQNTRTLMEEAIKSITILDEFNPVNVGRIQVFKPRDESENKKEVVPNAEVTVEIYRKKTP